MQVKYMTTNHYVRREGNVIDFCEYRDRMQRVCAAEAVAGDSVTLARPQEEETWEEAFPPRYVKPRRRKHFGVSDFLEICASAGVLAMGLLVWVQFLF